MKIMLTKKIRIKSNVNYNSNILKIFEYVKELFNDDEEKLYTIFA